MWSFGDGAVIMGLKRCVVNRRTRGVDVELGVIKEKSGGKAPSVSKSKVTEFSKADAVSPESEAIEQVGENSGSVGAKVLEDTASTSNSDKTTLTTSSVCPEPNAGSRFVALESIEGVSFKMPMR